MTTIDQNGSIHRGRGTGGGPFAGHARTAPAAALSELEEVAPSAAPETVRSPEFTMDVLEAHFETTLMPEGSRRDGSEVVILERVAGYHERLIIDEYGDIASREVWSPGSQNGHGQFIPAGFHDEELHQMMTEVRKRRLVAAGFDLGRKPGAGHGVYGLRQVGARASDGWQDASEVSKQLRLVDLRRAVEFGALPSDLIYRPRTRKASMMQAIDVDVYGLADNLALVEQDGFARQSPYARSITYTIEQIGAQYNDVDRDMYTDYNNSKFFFHVHVKSEREAAWEHEQQQDATRKRALAAPNT